MKGLIFNVSQMRTAGAHRIATHLRDNGWDIEVLDYVPFLSFEELQSYAISRIDSKTKFIGFSHLWTFWPAEVVEFIKWLKNNYQDIIIISGSPTYSGDQDKNIDYSISGWAENAITKLLQYLFSNGEKPVFSMNNQILANATYPAAPQYNPIIKYEKRDFLKPSEWVSIEFSRGCKFSCDFCSVPFLGIQQDWSRGAESFERQVKDAYDRFGITQYVVSDDTFNDREEKVMKYADVVEKLNFSPFFSGFIRPDLLVSRKSDKENLLRMNFIGHFYGVESFNRASAKSIGKGISPDKLKTGLLDVKKYFSNNNTKLYRGTISLIAGLPSDNIETLNETKKWLVENWHDENFVFYPLHISDPSTHGEDSSLSRNYQKYGYKKIPIKNIVSENEKLIFDLHNTVIWENDQMDFISAFQFSNEMYEILSKGSFRIGNYPMTFIPKPIFETINLRLNPQVYSDTFPITGEEYEYVKKFVKEYYNQKMSVI